MPMPNRMAGAPPVQNPVYVNNDSADFKRVPQPQHVLARPPTGETDPRLTAYGDVPRVEGGLPAYVPMAGQTPYNVWALYPA